MCLTSPHRDSAGARPSRLFSVVELVALRRVAPRPAAQRLPANRAVGASRSAAARGGVVAARQTLPLNRYDFTGQAIANRYGQVAIEHNATRWKRAGTVQDLGKMLGPKFNQLVALLQPFHSVRPQRFEPRKQRPVRTISSPNPNQVNR